MITLFRSSTGEDWQALMSDLWKNSGREEGCIQGLTCGPSKHLIYYLINFSRS